MLTALIACLLPQFLSIGIGLWWLFMAIGAIMVLIYRQPEIYGRKGLKEAIISAQLVNLIGGISFYFFENYRSEIVLIVGAFCLIYPARKMVALSQEINKELQLNSHKVQ